MACEGVGQTIKNEQMVYFCTAIKDPKNRIYSTNAEKVCPAFVFCRATEELEGAKQRSDHELQSGRHGAMFKLGDKWTPNPEGRAPKGQ